MGTANGSDKKNGAPVVDSLVEGKRTEKMLAVGHSMYASLIEWYRTQLEYHAKDIDPFDLSVMGQTVLTQYAAVVAVDLGVPEDKFLKICEVLYKNAYANAPKFG